MKKILCILILLPLFSKAQDSTSHVFFGGISYSNDLSYRLSKADGDIAYLKQEFDSLESSRYGFSAGVFAGYNFNAALSVRAGLHFSRYGYAIDTLQAAGFTNMRFNYNYVELPIRISHVFKLQRKVQPIVSLGVYTGYLLQHKTTHFATGEPQRISYEDGQTLSSINLGVIGAVGFQKNIAPNYRIELEGSFRQCLTPIGDTPLKRYLFSTGVNFSIVRSF
jgi:Outer membrane protein beta-barrel domain